MNFLKTFHLLLDKCNRKTRRALGGPDYLLAIDSTTITVGEGRLKWAKFHGKRARVKLHVALDTTNNKPVQVEETIAKKYDGPVGEPLTNSDYILVEDRYAKIKRFDAFRTDSDFWKILANQRACLETSDLISIFLNGIYFSYDSNTRMT